MASSWEETLVVAISTIGFLSLSKPILIIFKWVYCMFIRPPKTLATNYGSWALVTGSTDGIGRALALDLASRGVNLVLVGRSHKKLKAISDEIRANYSSSSKYSQVHIKTITVDLEKFDGEEIEETIRREIDGLDVGVLINNAGSSAKGPRFFHENDIEDIDNVLKVNLDGLTWVTKAVLPSMLKRRKGAVVNIGSGSSAIVPSFPFSAVYAATKAYVAMFSRTLSVEYKNHGIDFQCQAPMYVATKMVSNCSVDRAFFIPSPEEFSEASVRWIGYESLCVPYWTHALQAYVLRLLPDSVVTRAVYRIKLGMRNKLLFEEKSNKPWLNQKS